MRGLKGSAVHAPILEHRMFEGITYTAKINS
jgi:hypothetical protein